MSNNFLIVADYQFLLEKEHKKADYANMMEYFTLCEYLRYNSIFYDSAGQLFTTLCWYFQTEARCNEPVTFEVIGINYKKIEKVVKVIKYFIQTNNLNNDITINPMMPFSSSSYRAMIDLTPLFESEEK